ncbi:hypothetical protein L9F63_007651, partial [Diploptera punctata]
FKDGPVIFVLLSSLVIDSSTRANIAFFFMEAGYTQKCVHTQSKEICFTIRDPESTIKNGCKIGKIFKDFLHAKGKSSFVKHVINAKHHMNT